MVGRTVSHYRIVEKLGEGAMGVVYLAEDTHLARPVAIKFLTDSEHHHYRARFLREARAVSTLSHPHIAIVHDYGETAEGQPFIVMEYIKGETLSDLLHSSSLTIKQAVEVVEAAAEALAAAHAKGIIHRDIKPSNVIVNKEGQVKVLDFGLVKQLHEERAPEGGPDANTLLARTSSNIIIGTPLYLSPEQAMGTNVDARSDLFALGALLYECLAGRPAFSGGSVIEIGAQIIHFNPPPPSSINKRVNPELDRITLKALAKKPESRYQTASEFVADLRATRSALIKEDGHRTQRLVVSKPSHSSAFKSISDSLRRPRLSIGFFILALLIGIPVIWYVIQRPQLKRVPFQNMAVTKVTNTGRSLTAEVSPDGKYIAHVLEDAGQQSLVLTYMATASNVVIAQPSDVRYQAITFSNDGNYIYFMRHEKNESGLLYQVPALGGSSRTILSNVDSKITFAPDGKRFAFVRFDKGKGEYSLMVAETDGSGERRLATRSNPDLFSIYGLAWSPNGDVIACLDGSFTGGFHMRVIEVRVADGVEKPITLRTWFGITRVAWLKDGTGMLITVAEESVSPIQIWFVSYPEGQAQRVTNDSNDYRDLSLTADSHTLVSVQHSRLVTMWVAPNADSNRAVQITSGVGWTYGLAWTPDNRIVYSTMASGKLDLWTMASDGTDKVQLTNDAGSNYHPAVSANGKTIFFSSSRTGPFSIWRMDVDGNNQKQLTDTGSDIHPYPTPDGLWVIFQRGGGGGGRPTLWKVSVNGGNAVQLTDANLSVPVVSPDGKMIACRYLDESNTQKIAIISSEGGSPLKVFNIPIHPWQRIRWTRDGSALTYVDVRAGIANIWSQPLDGGPARQVTDFRADQIFSYDWSRDGKQLACERGVETNDVVLITDSK